MSTAYTELNTIHNPATGTSPPATWGDGVRDNFDAIYNPPLASVSNSAVQVIADSTETVLLYDTEVEDTDTLHSTVTNTGRFTAAKAGWYHVICMVSWESSATGRRRLTLRKNGSATGFYDSRSGETGGTTNHTISALVDLAATDYVDVQAYQTSGGDLDATALYQIVRVSGT